MYPANLAGVPDGLYRGKEVFSVLGHIPRPRWGLDLLLLLFLCQDKKRRSIKTRIEETPREEKKKHQDKNRSGLPFPITQIEIEFDYHT